MAAPAFSTNDALFATVQVATLQAGAIRMPRGIRSVLIEIGCSDIETMDEEVLPQDTSSFLVAFEPLLDKYSTLAARGNSRINGNGATNMAVPLGFHHPRGVVLPLAVAPSASMVTFNVHRTAGCSSLLNVSQGGGWAPWCAQALEKRTVPAITLATALALARPSLPVKLLKIDVQGMDLRLIQATNRANLSHVQAVSIELAIDTPRCRGSRLVYADRELCPAAIGYMASIGFKYVGHAQPVASLQNSTVASVQNGTSLQLVDAHRCPENRGTTGWKCEIEAFFLNEAPRKGVARLTAADIPLSN